MRENFVKKLLTIESKGGYSESLKTASTAFTPRQSVFFMPMAWTRAENNQYQPKHLLAAFSEFTPLSYLTAILKKANTMTKSIKKSAESTIQSLYRYWNEMRDAWYKGKYSLDQEDIYFDAFNALEQALLKLPAQCAAGREKEAFELINQIAGE